MSLSAKIKDIKKQFEYDLYNAPKRYDNNEIDLLSLVGYWGISYRTMLSSHEMCAVHSKLAERVFECAHNDFLEVFDEYATQEKLNQLFACDNNDEQNTQYKKEQLFAVDAIDSLLLAYSVSLAHRLHKQYELLDIEHYCLQVDSYFD